MPLQLDTLGPAHYFFTTKVFSELQFVDLSRPLTFRHKPRSYRRLCHRPQTSCQPKKRPRARFKPKTRYSGHLSSRLSRRATQHDQTTQLSSIMESESGGLGGSWGRRAGFGMVGTWGLVGWWLVAGWTWGCRNGGAGEGERAKEGQGGSGGPRRGALGGGEGARRPQTGEGQRKSGLGRLEGAPEAPSEKKSPKENPNSIRVICYSERKF